MSASWNDKTCRGRDRNFSRPVSEFRMTTPASQGVVVLAKIKHWDQEIHPQDDETARFFDRPIRDRLPSIEVFPWNDGDR